MAACKVDSKADMEVRLALPKAQAAAAVVKFTWLTFVPVRHGELTLSMMVLVADCC